MIFTVPNFMFHFSLSMEYSSIDNDIAMSINSVILYFVRIDMGKIKRLTLLSKYEDGSLKMRHPESLIKSQRIVCL